MLMGKGKMMVELCSTEIEFRVCRYLSCTKYLLTEWEKCEVTGYLESLWGPLDHLGRLLE